MKKLRGFQFRQFARAVKKLHTIWKCDFDKAYSFLFRIYALVIVNLEIDGALVCRNLKWLISLIFWLTAMNIKF